MSLDAILDRRLVIISGKGGVGKTTVAAALGALAAKLGTKVLICEVEGKQALGHLFDGDPLQESARQLRPNLFGISISASKALEEYFDVQFHMKRIAKPLISSQLVYYITHAAPGLRDILMLGKVWHEATRKRDFDLIVLDTPASGHAVSMLRSPQGFLDAVPLGPLANHARQVMEWLQDPQQVSINLVSMAEEMPVAETIETTSLLENKLAMDVTNVFVNMLYPPLFERPPRNDSFEELDKKLEKSQADALKKCADFYQRRFELQQGHRARLDKTLKNTVTFTDLPYLFTRQFGEKEIDHLADEMQRQLT